MDRRKFLTGAVAGAAAGVAAGVAGRVGWEKRNKADKADERGPIPEYARLSFSQQGEDIVLFHALRDVMKIENATYMDVGAAHPRKSNNTYLLHWNGCHGVLVEPNPMFAKMCRDERPKDIVVEAGIGVTETTEADYYEIKGNPMLNTFSPDQVKELQKGKTEDVVERVRKMPLLSINKVIEQHLGGKSPDLLSTDVIHSLWIPNLQGKIDLVPGRLNELWLRADQPGVYRGQCAEYCGLQHAKMALVVVADSPDDFERWPAANRAPASPPTTPEEQRGRDIVERGPCAMCHTIAGTSAGGRSAPDLTHLASRSTIGAGTLPNTKGYLAGWIADPQHIKPGNRMPPTGLNGEELQAVLAYLETLK